MHTHTHTQTRTFSSCLCARVCKRKLCQLCCYIYLKFIHLTSPIIKMNDEQERIRTRQRDRKKYGRNSQSHRKFNSKCQQRYQPPTSSMMMTPPIDILSVNFFFSRNHDLYALTHTHTHRHPIERTNKRTIETERYWFTDNNILTNNKMLIQFIAIP